MELHTKIHLIILVLIVCLFILQFFNQQRNDTNLNEQYLKTHKEYMLDTYGNTYTITEIGRIPKI